jgi:hypothetical protein
MTDVRHPEQREGSPEHGALPIPKLPHVVRDDGHLKLNALYFVSQRDRTPGIWTKVKQQLL